MNKIHITTATDKNYVGPMLGMMSSAMHCCPKNNVIVFHVVGDGLDKNDTDMVEGYVRTKGHEVNWLTYDVTALDIPLVRHFTGAACLRLFLADIISKDIDRIIYLDTDVILCNDALERLSRVDLHGCALAAVADVDVNFRQVKQRIGLGKSHRYFNSGVLVIDLKKWRGGKAGERHSHILEAKKDSLYFVDQDILNLAWSGDVYYLPLEFNATSAIFALPKKRLAKNGYTVNDIYRGITSPRVIHFYAYTYNRPWRDFCYHPLKQMYIDAMQDTPLGYRQEKTPIFQGACFLFEHIFAYIPLIIKNYVIGFLSAVKAMFVRW